VTAVGQEWLMTVCAAARMINPAQVPWLRTRSTVSLGLGIGPGSNHKFATSPAVPEFPPTSSAILWSSSPAVPAAMP